MPTYEQTLAPKIFFALEGKKEFAIFAPDGLVGEEGYTLAVRIDGKGAWFGLESVKGDLRTFGSIDSAAKLARKKGVKKIVLHL